MLMLRRLNVITNAIKLLKNLSNFAPISKMNEGFIEINSVPTHIFTFGQWIQDKFDENTKELVLIISGNPGLPAFYVPTFGNTLYDELGRNVPIWIIGHAGHDEPAPELNMLTPSLKGNEHLYDLNGQLQHKISFINRFVPSHVKVHLIGHSVGAKLCLDLLKSSPFNDQVQHVYLMFPTIERINDSKKGRLMPRWSRFFFLLRIFYNAFNYLPRSWKQSVVQWQMRREGMSDEFLQPSMEYTNPRVIDRIWFMALDEMEKIREIDDENIRSNMCRLKLYYGAKDDWVRTEYYYELVERYPGIDAELCDKGYEHAFVLKSGIAVGKMIAGWINHRESHVNVVDHSNRSNTL